MAPRNREVEIEDDEDLTTKTQGVLDTTEVDDDLDTKDEEDVVDKKDDDVDHEDDRRMAYDEDDDDGPSERGTSRRARRNKARRDARDQSRAVILAQEERIRRLEASIDGMGRAQLGLHAGDIDSQIAGVHGHLAQIDDAIGDAMVEQNKDKMKRAMRLRDEANQRLAILGNERQRLEVIARQGAAPQAERKADPALGMVDVDPEAERLSNIFLDRHPWFDPKDNQDEDSQIVKSIDDTLVNQGYKPNTSRYWKELERRVEARGLGAEGEDNVDDRDDDRGREERRPAPRRNSGGLPPRSRRGAGGGRPGVSGDRDLPALAKDTLDQLGLLDKKGLDKDQLAERENYIKTWRQGLRDAAQAQRNR